MISVVRDNYIRQTMLAMNPRITMTTLTVEQCEAVATARNPYLRVVDPESQTEYVLMRADVFERLNNRLFDSEPITADEKERLFAEAAKRAHWDDPEFDVYNDLDPRSRP